MNPIMTSLTAAMRGAMRRHQGLSGGRRRPMWQLLLGEVAWLLRRLRGRDRG